MIHGKERDAAVFTLEIETDADTHYERCALPVDDFYYNSRWQIMPLEN